MIKTIVIAGLVSLLHLGFFGSIATFAVLLAVI